MDNELFELCKDVYERTGWETPDWYDLDPDGKPEEYLSTTEDKIDENDYVPFYTSDYLLEKLPHTVAAIKGGSNSEAYIVQVGKIEAQRQFADTPLKALLKLTIALHQAGALKG